METQSGFSCTFGGDYLLLYEDFENAKSSYLKLEQKFFEKEGVLERRKIKKEMSPELKKMVSSLHLIAMKALEKGDVEEGSSPKRLLEVILEFPSVISVQFNSEFSIKKGEIIRVAEIFEQQMYDKNWHVKRAEYLSQIKITLDAKQSSMTTIDPFFKNAVFVCEGGDYRNPSDHLHPNHRFFLILNSTRLKDVLTRYELVQEFSQSKLFSH